MSKITTIGLDIAKNYFQIHGVNENGKAVFKKKVTRAKFMETMTNLPKCLVGMEACGGAHYWANRLMQLGFDVKLMSPRKVKTFVENHKNDAKDAEACAEAVTRGNMLFVPPKKYRLPNVPHKRILNGREGYTDFDDNVWTKGPSRTKGESFEWDVQLSDRGKIIYKHLSIDGKHLNVSLDGKITH